MIFAEETNHKFMLSNWHEDKILKTKGNANTVSVALCDNQHLLIKNSECTDLKLHDMCGRNGCKFILSNWHEDKILKTKRTANTISVALCDNQHLLIKNTECTDLKLHDMCGRNGCKFQKLSTYSLKQYTVEGNGFENRLNEIL